jgi:hypothetical protein
LVIWILEGDGGFWASSQHVTYKLKDSTLSYSVRMKFYITQKGELELLNTEDPFKFPAYLYFKMDIQVINIIV